MKEIGIVTVTLASSEADLPDGSIPPSEVPQLVLEAGYDPGEIIEEIADWHERGPRVRDCCLRSAGRSSERHARIEAVCGSVPQLGTSRVTRVRRSL
jgi:hypothetical protein